MNKRLINLTPDAADGGDTGASGQAEPAVDILEGAGQAAEPAAEPAATVEPAATPAPSNLSRDDIQEILAGAMSKVGAQAAPAPAATPEPQMSQEDFERTFNVMKVSPELLTQMRSEDPLVATKALTTFRDGVIRQAMTMAEYRVQQRLDSLTNEHIAPLRTFVSEQQATSFRNDFFKKHADLEPYEAIVDAVAAKLQASGFKGDSREAVMTKFAEETKKIVSQLTTTGQGATTTTGGAAAPAPGKNKMSTLTGGGQQSGGRSTTPAKGPPGIDVFD